MMVTRKINLMIFILIRVRLILIKIPDLLSSLFLQVCLSFYSDVIRNGAINISSIYNQAVIENVEV